MNREANIVTEKVHVVELIEDGVVKERRYLQGKSRYYAEDCAENWVTGVIKEPNTQYHRSLDVSNVDAKSEDGWVRV